MEPNQVLLLLAVVLGVVIFMRILKATLKLIVIVAVIVLIAGYFGLDLVEIGQDVYDSVEEPAVELIEDGLDINLADGDDEGFTSRVQQSVDALRDLGFQVDIGNGEVEFWEGNSFTGNVDADNDSFLLNVNLDQEQDKERALKIISGLNERTISPTVQDDIVQVIEEGEDVSLSFENGYLEIENNNLEMKIDTSDT